MLSRQRRETSQPGATPQVRGVRASTSPEGAQQSLIHLPSALSLPPPPSRSVSSPAGPPSLRQPLKLPCPRSPSSPRRTRKGRRRSGWAREPQKQAPRTGFRSPGGCLALDGPTSGLPGTAFGEAAPLRRSAAIYGSGHEDEIAAAAALSRETARLRLVARSTGRRSVSPAVAGASCVPGVPSASEVRAERLSAPAAKTLYVAGLLATSPTKRTTV